jgi:hypothetical protein
MKPNQTKLTALLKTLTASEIETVEEIVKKVQAYLLEGPDLQAYAVFGAKTRLQKKIPLDLLADCFLAAPISTPMDEEQFNLFVELAKSLRA